MTDRDRSDKGRLLFRSGLLDQAVARLEAAHHADPGNLILGIRLVDAYRASGKLNAAAETVARLIETAPSDGSLRHLHSIFSGAAGAPVAIDSATLPAAFVVHDDFLPESERAQLWDFTVNASPGLEQATIARRFAGPDVDQRVDASVRRARTLPSPRRVARLMEPRLRPVVAADAARLGLEVPEIDHIEMELAVYGDGDHFQCHQDLYEAESTRRVVTFVYFFSPEPRGFSGGELLLYDTDRTIGTFAPNKFTRIDPVPNRLVLFDPSAYHEVTPIRCPSEDPRDLRYTATGWVHEAIRS